MITQSRLKELLSYDHSTGVFTWIVNLKGRGGSVKVGKVAGSYDTKGKLQIKIDGKYYFGHRLAFLYMTGEMPKNQVDHINRNHKDNRWSNLREASPSENAMNRVFRKGRSLPRGVYVNQWGTIFASIQDGKKLRYIGKFETVEDAHKAYMAELSKKPHFIQYYPIT